MKRKVIVIIAIIFFVTMTFFIDYKSSLGFTPSDHGKQWRSLNNSEQTHYLYGLKDGYEQFIIDTVSFFEKKGEEFQRFHKHMELQSSFFRHMYDIKIEVMQKALSDIYKDPANTYIEPYYALCVAIEKIEGKSIETELLKITRISLEIEKNYGIKKKKQIDEIVCRAGTAHRQIVMTIKLNNILAEFKQALAQRYGDQIGSLVCYGSQARGEAGPDSDIDLVLVLNKKVQPSREIDKLIDILVDFNLRYGVLISLLPVSQDTWETGEGPFWRNVRREGSAI